MSEDELYALLMEAHDGLSDAEVAAFHARLILLLVDAVDDPGKARQCIERAIPSSPHHGRQEQRERGERH